MLRRGQIRKIIKRDVRAALRGRWGQAILIGLIIMAVSAGVSFVIGSHSDNWPDFLGYGVIQKIFFVLALSPLILGQTSWYMGTLRGKRPELSSAFSWYGSGRTYQTAVLSCGFFELVEFILFIIIAIFSIIVFGMAMVFRVFNFFPDVTMIPHLFTLPFSGGNGFPSPSPYMWHQIWAAFGIIMVAAGIIMAFYAAAKVYLIRFIAVYNIAVDKPHAPIGEILSESQNVMRGHAWDIIWFYLSFVGWYLLVPLTFGLILFYLLPYMHASKLLYIEYFRDMVAKADEGHYPGE